MYGFYNALFYLYSTHLNTIFNDLRSPSRASYESTRASACLSLSFILCPKAESYWLARLNYFTLSHTVCPTTDTQTPRSICLYCEAEMQSLFAILRDRLALCKRYQCRVTCYWWQSTTTNAAYPGQIGRKTNGAMMGQFSGVCYRSLVILLFLGLQFPATVARGKNSSEFVILVFARTAVCCASAGICTCTID